VPTLTAEKYCGGGASTKCENVRLSDPGAGVDADCVGITDHDADDTVVAPVCAPPRFASACGDIASAARRTAAAAAVLQAVECATRRRIGALRHAQTFVVVAVRCDSLNVYVSVVLRPWIVGVGGTPLTVVSFWSGSVSPRRRCHDADVATLPLTTVAGVELSVATAVLVTSGVVVPEHTPVATVHATLHCVTEMARPLVASVVSRVEPVPVTPSVRFFAARPDPFERSTNVLTTSPGAMLDTVCGSPTLPLPAAIVSESVPLVTAAVPVAVAVRPA
jgi:hypothetical protein